MRLAGITWWRGNYGSILQAYALQEILSSFENIEYEILDQFGEFGTASSLIEKIKAIGVKNTWKKIKWKFLTKDLRSRNAALMRFVDQYLRVSKIRYTKETIKESLDVYDGYICGSDQIWNPVLSPLDEIYWLSFAGDDKIKIAYAPSIGITEADQETKNIIRLHLESFKAVSCREQPGTEFINQIIGSDKCKTVLDPTLLVSTEKWDSILPLKCRFGDEKYVFAYILRGDKKQRQLVEEYAQSKGLKVIAFPFLDSDLIEKYDAHFGDKQVYDATPSDFIALIKHADYVFTDSFHCAIFSILYHRSFCLFPKIGKTQNNRLYDLQARFGIKNRMISECSLEQIESLNDIDWIEVESKLKTWREVSFAYLVEALKE